MSLGTVISLCERTGNMVRPWLEAGYDAITVDLQEAPVSLPGRRHIISDVTDISPEFAVNNGAVAVFAFPPCTHLAVSGARWFKEKGLDKVIDALRIVNACKNICELSGAPYLIENPVGTLSTYWREADYVFHPCQYAGYSPDPGEDAYTKKTCLWTGNGFVMPDPKPIDPVLGSKMFRLAPSDDRADLRSETPLGFAYAVFAALHPRLAFGNQREAVL